MYIYIKISTGYYQKKNKERLSKTYPERYPNFSTEKKDNFTNILGSDIEIFLKKTKKRSIKIVVNEHKANWSV